MDTIRELVRIFKEAGIGELTVRIGDWRVTIRSHTVLPQPGVPAEQPKEATGVTPKEDPSKHGRPSLVPVTSRWVGIVRRTINGKGLVRVGDQVRKGQTVCWVDSLGVANEVRAPESGRVVEILVEDGQPVEFGQTLMSLELEKTDA